MGKFDIAVIGGDKRTACMACMLADKGFKVVCINTCPVSKKLNFCDSLLGAVSSSSAIIGGIPFTKGDYLYCENTSQLSSISISDLKRCMRKHQKIFAGVIPDDFRRTCDEREIYCHDFMLDEPMTIKNAVSTAEGAILEALLHKNTTLHQSNTLVIGFGRCGKMIADRLSGFHAKITICSNDSNELSLAFSLGFNILPLSEFSPNADQFEYIFNTIPFQAINEKTLRKITSDTLIIDIASNKTGADYNAALKYGTNILYCPGLPGKYSPKSSAELLTNYVINRL
jgi:dipicolinate synthase subunit A